MYCKKCGSQLSPGAEFCKECGQPVSDESNPSGDTNAPKLSKSKKHGLIKKIGIGIAVIFVVLLVIGLFGDSPVTNTKAIIFDQYELRPSRENLDIRRQMDAQAQVVGKWEDAHHVPDQKRLTWFYPDFGSYVVKEYITPEQLAVRVRSIERQEAARAHKEAKHQPPIAEQLKAAQREAQEQRAPDAPKKKAPDRGDR